MSDHRLPSAPSWRRTLQQLCLQLIGLLPGVKTHNLRVTREGPGLAGPETLTSSHDLSSTLQGLPENGNASTMASATTQHWPARVKGWRHLSIPIWWIQASMPAAMP